MWKSTSLTSVSQFRTKRTDGAFSTAPWARSSWARISPARAGSARIQAAAMRPTSSRRIRSAPANQIDDRSVGARREREIARGLTALAERDQRQDVALILLAPRARLGQRR